MHTRPAVRILLVMVSGLPWACGGESPAATAPRATAPPPVERPTETATAKDATAVDAFRAAIAEANAGAPPTSNPVDAEMAQAVARGMEEMEQAMAESLAKMEQAMMEANAGAPPTSNPVDAEMAQAMAEGMEEMGEAMAAGMEEMGEAIAQGMADSMAVFGEVMAAMIEVSPRLQALEENYDLDTEEGMRAAADEMDAIAADIRTRAAAAENPQVQDMLAGIADELVATATLAREDPQAAVQQRRDKMAAESAPATP